MIDATLPPDDPRLPRHEDAVASPSGAAEQAYVGVFAQSETQRGHVGWSGGSQTADTEGSWADYALSWR